MIKHFYISLYAKYVKLLYVNTGNIHVSLSQHVENILEIPSTREKYSRIYVNIGRNPEELCQHGASIHTLCQHRKNTC